jgi:hypothetical protein
MALEAKVDTVLNESFTIELLASATAANGIPSGTAGIPTSLLKNRRAGKVPDSIRVGVKSTAGSGVMTVTLRVWGRAGALWFRLKDLNAADSAPHTAVAIPETSADAIQYSEVVTGVAGCDRLYLEIVAIAGTATAVTGYAIVG